MILAVPVVMAVGAGKELDRYGGFDTSDQGDGDPGRFTGTALGTGTGDRRPR